MLTIEDIEKWRRATLVEYKGAKADPISIYKTPFTEESPTFRAITGAATRLTELGFTNIRVDGHMIVMDYGKVWVRFHIHHATYYSEDTSRGQILISAVVAKDGYWEGADAVTLSYQEQKDGTMKLIDEECHIAEALLGR